jgi:hypothetical protein
MLALLCLSAAAYAADDQQLALAIKAQSDFDRVSLAAIPQLRDTGICIQSQAALLAVSPVTELAELHYRRGYCTLAEAAIRHDAAQFSTAAAEFDSAIQTWQDRFSKKIKVSPEPVPPALHALAAVARLNAGIDKTAVAHAREEISAIEAHAACPAGIISENRCQEALRAGREWLGWMALERDDLWEAARDFAGSAGTGWPDWVRGREAFHDRKYADAARSYAQAIEIWRQHSTPYSVLAMIAPQPDLPAALTALGGAQILSGNSAAAIATLDAAIKLDPAAARNYYLRGRARDAAGESEAAASDYSTASRRALAAAKDQASGEGHFYRALMLYRRKQFTQAEDEFASALNFNIPTDLKDDAKAWRHLAAVAAGSCGTERNYLETALATVSRYFPKDEARATIAGCSTSAGLKTGKVADPR